MTFDDLKAEIAERKAKFLARPLWQRVAIKSWNETRAWVAVTQWRMTLWSHRIVLGYHSSDWWEYASNNSKRAVKLLTIFQKHQHGFFCMAKEPLDTWAEHNCEEADCKGLWDAALSDIIYFHTVVADKGSVFLETQEEKDRFKRGKQAYADQYERLWD